MDEKLVTIANFEQSVPANLARNALEAEHIPCFLANENTAEMLGLGNVARIALQVGERDRDRAEEILASMTTGDNEARHEISPEAIAAPRTAYRNAPGNDETRLWVPLRYFRQIAKGEQAAAILQADGIPAQLHPPAPGESDCVLLVPPDRTEDGEIALQGHEDELGGAPAGFSERIADEPDSRRDEWARWAGFLAMINLGTPVVITLFGWPGTSVALASLSIQAVLLLCVARSTRSLKKLPRFVAWTSFVVLSCLTFILGVVGLEMAGVIPPLVSANNLDGFEQPREMLGIWEGSIHPRYRDELTFSANGVFLHRLHGEHEFELRGRWGFLDNRIRLYYTSVTHGSPEAFERQFDYFPSLGKARDMSVAQRGDDLQIQWFDKYVMLRRQEQK